MKKRMKSIIVDTGQNEKNDNATINRNDKKNYITSNVGKYLIMKSNKI